MNYKQPDDRTVAMFGALLSLSRLPVGGYIDFDIDTFALMAEFLKVHRVGGLAVMAATAAIDRILRKFEPRVEELRAQGCKRIRIVRECGSDLRFEDGDA